MLSTLGIAQHHVARLFGVGPRSVRRWQRGDRNTPCGVGIVLRLLAAGTVTVARVEQAAIPVPVRTNGGAEPEPAAPLFVAPAPEQSVVADVKAAAFSTFADPTSADPTSADPTFADSTFADPGPTTAEKVCALAPEACRWPYGDPRRRSGCSEALLRAASRRGLRDAADWQRAWHGGSRAGSPPGWPSTACLEGEA
jgi:hypothetical protein